MMSTKGIVEGTYIYGDEEFNRCFYERAVELDNGDILATWMRSFPVEENWVGTKSYLFYRSGDKGKTWAEVSELDPAAYGVSRDKQGMPGMFVLPVQLGEYPAGTILFANTDWDPDDAYTMNIWRSTDRGETWQLHSKLSPRRSRNTWEPEFAVSADGRLVCYYSDEGEPGYDQCIALEISDDGGVTWGDYQVLVGHYVEGWIPGEDEAQWRPGMPRVLKLKNGSYMMVYENIHSVPAGAVTFRISEDGINWGDREEKGTMVTDGTAICFQCPTLALIDDGSECGRIFIRGMNDSCSPSMCLSSTDNGATWELIDAPLTALRMESVGSGWSGTFIATGDMLIEVNNYFNGNFNEIRCGRGVLYGDQMLVDGADYHVVQKASGLALDNEQSAENGTAIKLKAENGADEQGWKLDIRADSKYSIYNNYSQFAMTAESAQAGANVVQKQAADVYSVWDLLAQSEQIRIQNTGSGFYLDTEQLPEDGGLIAVQKASGGVTQEWQLKRIYAYTRFESKNISRRFIRRIEDDSVIIAEDLVDLPMSDSQWRVIPGLADTAQVTLESVGKPGYYLRHYEGSVIVSPDDGSEIFHMDATWRMRQGLADASMVSFETYNFNGIYLRHRDGKMIISEIEVQMSLDMEDATFRPIKQ